MTNLVSITVKATDDSNYAAIRASAAKAGDDAAKAFNDAFKLKADASTTAKERLEQTGGLGGKDESLMNRLKSYANTPGGIGILGTGNDTSLMSMLKNQIRSMGQSGGPGLLSTGGGTTSSQDLIRQVMTGAGPSNVSTEDIIRQVMEGAGPSNVTTEDLIKQVLGGTSPGNVTTEDFIKQVLEGTTPGNISTKDVIHPTVDDSDIAALGQKDGKTYGDAASESMKSDMKGGVEDAIDDSGLPGKGDSDGRSYGSSFGSALKDTLTKMLGSGGGGGGSLVGGLLTGSGSSGDGGAVSGVLDSGGVAGGALPGIAGVSGMAATVTGLAGALVAVLPAITSVIGGLGGIGIGVGALAGGFALLDATNKTFASDVTSTFSGMESVAAKAAAPLTGPLESGLSQLGSLVKSIGPQLTGLFSASAGMVQPLVTGIKSLVTDGMAPLTAIIKDATPLIAPLMQGFQGLLSGAAPGFIAMVKAAGPVFSAVASSFSDLGKSLGTMFTDFASDGSGSATILKGFLDIINSLLPFIGELGKVMVSALAPAFTAFAGALSSVLPALSPLMSTLGSFAGAVLTDLGGVLSSVGTVLVDLAPSFNTLAKAASSVFTAMENTGVFASLGNVLEGLAGPIANLVNALVKGLAPAIPGIVTAFSDVSKVLTGALVTVVGGLANGLAAIVKAIPVPVLTGIVDAFVAWKVAMLAMSAGQAILTGLTTVMSALPGIIGAVTAAFDIETISLKAMYLWDGLVTVATEAWTAAQAVLDAVLDANPIALVVIALAALGAAIYEIVDHWSTVETELKAIWTTISTFFEGIWNTITANFKTAVGGIENYLTGEWNIISGAAKTAWNALSSFFTGIWNTIETDAKSVWNAITSFLSGIWNTIFSNAKSIWGSIESWFGSLENSIKGIFNGAVNWLESIGGDIITGLWDGLKSVWNSVVSWFENIPSDILKALGINSPPQWAISAGKDILDGIMQPLEASANTRMAAVAQTIANAAKAAASAVAGAASSGSVSANEAALKAAAAAKGWTGAEWTALYNVEMAEAGFSLTATNPSSGAYGMAQFIGGAAEYAQYGGNANTAAGQSTAMVNYIADRYGNPEAAWAHEEAYGWYDKGGWLPTGKSIAVNNTGAPEMVLGPGGLNISLEIGSSGNAGFDAFLLEWIRNNVRIKGGGDVQAAFGRS